MDWKAEFEETGALLSGHFQLSSGLHSDRYLQCALLLQWPQRAERVGSALAALLSKHHASVVISPALGGVVIGHEVGRALGVRAVFAERKDGALQIRRGFAFSVEEPAVVIEDVFTTGKSTAETIEVATAAGANVVAAGSIVNRGMPHDRLRVPTSSLLELDVPSWSPESCPICAEGRPLESPGSRHKG